MGARTSGRQAAVQMLFGLDATGVEVEAAIVAFWREMAGDAEGRPYADECVRGVAEERAALDEIVSAASSNWRIERMTRVDRNVLRLGAWELLRRTDVPRSVVIDEAVELAKRFGSEESGAFVNGVLDRVAENLHRFDVDV